MSPARRRLGAALVLCLAALAAASAKAAGPEGALDNRGWELVSPPEKNGGELSPPSRPGAGVLQAAAQGGQVTFASSSSFGDAQGAAPQSQYLAGRQAGGWLTQNVTPPLLSGTYEGGAYQLFSADLSRAILDNGWRCRDGDPPCEAENPPLGPGAPAGYRNLYLREGDAYEPLITTANLPSAASSAETFELSLEGADPDLRHVVLVLDGGLYEWSQGNLTLIDSGPGATLAAPSGAISADGNRVYWTKGGNLYLHEGFSSVQVDEAQGGGGVFQTASTEGEIVYLTKAEHLYRYEASTGTATDLTPAGEVQGVLGSSSDGSYVYYLSTTGLWLHHEGTATKVAASADTSNYPPATGTARVTPDGTRLAFVSSAPLTGYPNNGNAEAFLYQAPSKFLFCASCNVKGNGPKGPSSLPGALAFGNGPAAYRPRALSADGARLFFDSSDAVISTDTDGLPDAYQWQARGTGGCGKTVGCVGLLSGGRVGSASFADASTDGTDAFFLTATSLLPADTGAVDLYDARSGGGFPEAPEPLPCVGDACQGPAPGPDDPAPATTLELGGGNPAPHFAKEKKQKPKKHKHKKHSKHKKHHKGTNRHGGRR